MSRFIAVPLFLALLFASNPAGACDKGFFRTDDGVEFAVVTRSADVLRYTAVDGRRGEVAPDELVSCSQGRLWLKRGGARSELSPAPLDLTASRFTSHGTELSGWLLEAPGLPADAPTVVLVHGSERTSPMDSANPYIFAAYGLRVFAYDKRGTGQSGGVYTQNFQLLADDAAAALTEAHRLTGGRQGRIGFYGGSQGGWVAPLAATRSPADFVAVGFGLVLSPLEEDREQVLNELRAMGHGEAQLAAARQVTDAVATVVSSGFERGYEGLADVRARHGAEAWFRQIRGELTGDILAMPEADLRRIGRARFDNLELLWDYDGLSTLRGLRIPILWVLAEADREAPPEVTLARLEGLRRDGVAVDIFSFPHTDHGIVEFEEDASGKRTYGRISEGYFPLLADWIKGRPAQAYGRARRR